MIRLGLTTASFGRFVDNCSMVQCEMCFAASVDGLEMALVYVHVTLHVVVRSFVFSVMWQTLRYCVLNITFDRQPKHSVDAYTLPGKERPETPLRGVRGKMTIDASGFCQC